MDCPNCNTLLLDTCEITFDGFTLQEPNIIGAYPGFYTGDASRINGTYILDVSSVGGDTAYINCSWSGVFNLVDAFTAEFYDWPSGQTWVALKFTVTVGNAQALMAGISLLSSTGLPGPSIYRWWQINGAFDPDACADTYSVFPNKSVTTDYYTGKVFAASAFGQTPLESMAEIDCTVTIFSGV